MGESRSVINKTGAGVLLLLLSLTLGCSKQEPPKVEPSPTPTPLPLLPRKEYATARLFNGILLKSSVKATHSEESALRLERHSESYTLELTLRLQVPTPATTAANLLAATPDLAEFLPNLDTLLTNATASPDFATLFENKEKNLKANLNTLQRLLPLDTLYDCQTILNLCNPTTARRALLIQALMNVNTDGSDGDRNLDLDSSSAFFQPQTNYRWPKVSAHPNPCLKETERRLSVIHQKLTAPTPLSATERSRLLDAESEEKATLDELKHWSFLVGAADPFIVLPSFMFHSTEGHPEIGDYAVVIANGIIFPAILGDKGPNYKMGEASLRLCQEIDESSTAEKRPIDHPTVTYLIFPGSAETPFASPNYKHWSERCHALWKEFGGSEMATWQEWESLEKPWPTPTPSPTPSPSLIPLPSPSPAASVSIMGSSSLSPAPASTSSVTSSSVSTPSTPPTPASSGTNPASSPTATNSLPTNSL
jgi:hypothetical protein